jgi:hypothetical protein
MKTFLRLLSFSCAATLTVHAASSVLLGWNNLGMHCMDSDYSVFSVLPPYNTIEAQLIVNGQLVTSSNGYTLTYQAVADPDGSFNSTAMGKGNFYTYAAQLYGAAPAPQMGLAGWAMPGPGNVPQSMRFEQTNNPAPGAAAPVNWFRAEGIPISPYDDALHKNPYPLMRIVARNSTGQAIATNDVVLPVSDEMDCRACHASGTQAAAQPAAGWVWNGLPERDYRMNILRLHDEHQFRLHAELYNAALAAKGFNAAGLYRSVTADGKPVLCAACHASEALGAPSYGTIPPLTRSVHSFHAHVTDPELNVTLDNTANRSACYRCHPGSTTRCLRGAMGGAIAADGSMEMQCQSCHGNMSQVGSADRVGWFMEPTCQGCHSGTATRNSGQIRYTSVFSDANGTPRTPADLTFATSTNTPAPGLSLYRFSAGHGGLQCSACHGSTHAEFPSTHRNDNLRNQQVQGHVGVVAECTACHTASPSTITGGPHGMHPVGQPWISSHHDAIDHEQATRSQCQVCHGVDYRGTVLSRMQANRTLSAFGTKSFVRGDIIGCYNCHNGPGSESRNTNAAPVVASFTTNTLNNTSIAALLPLTGAARSALRIVTQPSNGSVGLDSATGVATYYPNPSFVGTDKFTFSAYDGSKNANLATGTVAVAQGTVALAVTAQVPPSYPAGWPVAFSAVASVVNSAQSATFEWDFGDNTQHGSTQYSTHACTEPGTYFWTVTARLGSVEATASGSISIGGPVQLSQTYADNSITLSWPLTIADTFLEVTPQLGPQAQWQPVATPPAAVQGLLQNVALPGTITQTLPASGNAFFRVRRPW